MAKENYSVYMDILLCYTESHGENVIVFSKTGEKRS